MSREVALEAVWGGGHIAVDLFLGIWSLEGAAPPPSTVAAAAAALRAAVGADHRQISEGPLWLAATPSALVEMDQTCGAASGFLPAGLAAVISAAEDDARLRRQPGHFVLARAETHAQRLLLFRDAAGGERLFWTMRDSTLLFSCSARLLAAATGAGTDPDGARQFLMNGGYVLDYGRTLWRGIRELRAGQALRVSGGAMEWGPEAPMLPAQDGSPKTAAGDLLSSLEQAVAEALGNRREAAVALTGGVDSSVIAALACRALGPGAVTAYTFEFDDPARAGESLQAADVCRHLGIKRHRVVTITQEEHRRALPEAVWRAEEPGSMRGIGPVLLLARAAAQDGQSALLTGAGMEALLRVPLANHRYFRLLLERPPRERDLWNWRAHRFAESGPRPWISRLFSADPPVPSPPLYFLVLAILERAGLLKDIGRYFPDDISGLARRAAASAASALDESRGASLEEQLFYRFYVSQVLSMNLQRKIKLSREAGCVMAAPATFPVCAGQIARWSAHTNNVEPKALLAEAAAGLLPESVLRRPKNEDYAVISDAWARADAAALKEVERSQRPALEAELGESLAGASRWLPETARLALWRRVCIEGAADRPPTWDELPLKGS